MGSREERNQVFLHDTQNAKRRAQSRSDDKANLAQYMTPYKIAAFMASLFGHGNNDEFHLLDAGAGEGALTAAFLERWQKRKFQFSTGSVTLCEIDQNLLGRLAEKTSQSAVTLPVTCAVRREDFIETAANIIARRQRPFTHAILNPPYKKISSTSRQRLILDDLKLSTVNLYAAFVSLSLTLLRPGGQLVAIIPRSFCNGAYYRPFRKYLLRHAALKRIHLFASRRKVFAADGVLQESLIICLERDAAQGKVVISTSADGELTDLRVGEFLFETVVNRDDTESFIRIPLAVEKVPKLKNITCALDELGVEVSTGPVVDFRVKKYLHPMPGRGDVALLYPGHFNGAVQWPKLGWKKPNAIQLCQETVKWLYPAGFYTVVRRLSAKEEKRRVVANTVNPAGFKGMNFFGFENHLNIFHHRKSGLSEELALGLAGYLNSGYVDSMFRQFNGHTQVNATDLRALCYPAREKLASLGRRIKQQRLSLPVEIDRQLAEICNA
ncbi:MAG: Eco57I restriction-modification methylase domain-containing protein [Verrucomicrobiales bacterium]|jgi:tRNA1(Val) A37 N6-methylase TrmN6|nr:Eco57I restriction-modification methylase domain-containing protein [Verrucomicrobiales bacterium]